MSSKSTRKRCARRARGHGSGTGTTTGWRGRLARFLLALLFLAVHHVYTPIHLAAEDHLHVHGDRHVECAQAAFDGGPGSTHEPHPASDHGLTSAIPRALAQLEMVPGFETSRLVARLDPEPRTRPSPVPLLRPRPPPLTTSCLPRAPPVA